MIWFILLIGAVTFGVCFLLDKGFLKIFRNKPQHKTGLSVRLTPHYGGAGAVLIVLGIAAIFRGAAESAVLLFGGILVGLLGIGLAIYYLSFGIYYDKEQLVLSTFGKKSVTYLYQDIKGQKLYRLTGGTVLVELFFTDGRTVSLQSTMKGVYPFLDTAFSGWCSQKGIAPEDCAFHDAANSCWFPNVEE